MGEVVGLLVLSLHCISQDFIVLEVNFAYYIFLDIPYIVEVQHEYVD